MKIQADANPFDPRFEEYFEARHSGSMERNLAGRRRILFLWKRQVGLCPVCAQPITRLTKWHTHHKVRRVDGGNDSALNTYLLHPTCHRQHHANPKLKWRLPAGGDPGYALM